MKANIAVTFITVVIKIIITLLHFLKENPTMEIEAKLNQARENVDDASKRQVQVEDNVSNLIYLYKYCS